MSDRSPSQRFLPCGIAADVDMRSVACEVRSGCKFAFQLIQCYQRAQGNGHMLACLEMSWLMCLSTMAKRRSYADDAMAHSSPRRRVDGVCALCWAIGSRRVSGSADELGGHKLAELRFVSANVLTMHTVEEGSFSTRGTKLEEVPQAAQAAAEGVQEARSRCDSRRSRRPLRKLRRQRRAVDLLAPEDVRVLRADPRRLMALVKTRIEEIRFGVLHLQNGRILGDGDPTSSCVPEEIVCAPFC